MNTTRPIAAALGFLLFASLTHGQGMMAPTQGTPRITHLMPIGGQVGTSFELKVTGQDLKDVEGLHFSFPGVKVETTNPVTISFQ